MQCLKETLKRSTIVIKIHCEYVERMINLLSKNILQKEKALCAENIKTSRVEYVLANLHSLYIMR